MKFPVPFLAAFASKLAGVGAIQERLPDSGSLALKRKRRLGKRARQERAHFGDTSCPCIGFDNIEGETTVVVADDVEVSYPADLGARCEAWDNGVHPQCKEGQTPGFGNEWCGLKWCYVDSCNCGIPVLPKVTDYLADARYRGKPIFYSYATCGAEDKWAKTIPEVGSAGCRCVGFDDVAGDVDVRIQVENTESLIKYPAEVGGSCKAWDKNRHPLCKSGDKSLPFCEQRWCYVDPCSCKLSEPPKVTMYLPDATFTGKSLYYSYATCRGEDLFTEVYNTEACVNQYSQGECEALLRGDGAIKCAWTGSKCLGAELVTHPLCTKMAGNHSKKLSRSSAQPLDITVLRSSLVAFLVSTFFW